MNQIVQCNQKEVHRERASEFLPVFGVGVQNEAPGSYFACHVRQLVTRENSKPAYPIHNPWYQTINLKSVKSTANGNRSRTTSMLNRSNSSLHSIWSSRITLILSFTATANDTSKRAYPVADLDSGPYVPCPIEPSVILIAYNLYPFAQSDEVRLTLLSPVSHSSFWRNVM